MFNKEDARKLLDGFKPIPRDAWWHGRIILPIEKCDVFPDSGFCVGHLAGYILSKKRLKDILSICEEGVHYRVGIKALNRLFSVSHPLGDDFAAQELKDILRAHGAPHEPFGTEVWETDPYIVLRDAIKDRFGYDYEAELIEDLIPDNLFEDVPVDTSEELALA